MKIIGKIIYPTLLAIFLVVSGSSLSMARPAKGQLAPDFSLVTTTGENLTLSQQQKGHPLTVLFFFDATSRPSQEGLFSLDRLLKKYHQLDLLVWGVTTSARKEALSFVANVKPNFPVFLDTADVSEKYGAKGILPTVCLIGPQGKVINFIQGGGKTAEIMLTRLAQRTLQRKQADMAVAISEEVEKTNPKNQEIQAVKGYAALQNGELEKAEVTFKKMSGQSGKVKILGKEGLSSVYAQRGETTKALDLIEEVEKNAPERGHAHVVKGNILYSQNKKEEAQREFELAVEKKEAEPYQQAVAFNQLGRVNADKGNYQKARDLYDKAIEIDPYYVEATSNKGVSFEKEGQWQKALDSYEDAVSLNKNDVFAHVLAKKAAEMIAQQKDTENKKRIDKLVGELVDRFNKKKTIFPQRGDEWTSSPLILSFVDFQEKGGLSERDGFSLVLTSQLADLLNSSGRVQVVERVILDQLLAELNLGSSDLADPDTALRLGRVLAAKLIATGSLFTLPGTTLLSMRFIDTETTGIAKVFTREMKSTGSLDQELYQLNREILKTVISKYPLRGFVVNTMTDQVMLNIGSDQGVVVGTNFDVIVDQKPIKYKGKILQGGTETVGQIEVVKVQKDLSYAKIVHQARALSRDDKVIEVAKASVSVTD